MIFTAQDGYHVCFCFFKSETNDVRKISLVWLWNCERGFLFLWFRSQNNAGTCRSHRWPIEGSLSMSEEQSSWTCASLLPWEEVWFDPTSITFPVGLPEGLSFLNKNKKVTSRTKAKEYTGFGYFGMGAFYPQTIELTPCPFLSQEENMQIFLSAGAVLLVAKAAWHIGFEPSPGQPEPITRALTTCPTQHQQPG